MSGSLKRRGLSLLHRAGVLAAARRLRRSHALVLTYHGVLNGDDDSYDFLNNNFVAAGAFARHMAYLARHYRPIALRELIRCFERGEDPPAGAVTVTFDDGFANNRTVALPILQRYGIPATIFLTTGLIGSRGGQLWSERVKRAVFLSTRGHAEIEIDGHFSRYDLGSPGAREDAARHILGRLKRLPIQARDACVGHVEGTFGRAELTSDDEERYRFLAWEEVKAMSAEGVEFGAHTVSHPILSTLDESQLHVEVTESKRAIEAALGIECFAFAYPNGSAADFGEREKAALRRAGYRCAFALDGGLNGARPDLFALRRVNISREFDEPVFEGTLTGMLGAARRLRYAVSDFPARDHLRIHTAVQGGR